MDFYPNRLIDFLNQQDINHLKNYIFQDNSLGFHLLYIKDNIHFSININFNVQNVHININHQIISFTYANNSNYIWKFYSNENKKMLIPEESKTNFLPSIQLLESIYQILNKLLIQPSIELYIKNIIYNHQNIRYQLYTMDLYRLASIKNNSFFQEYKQLVITVYYCTLFIHAEDNWLEYANNQYIRVLPTHEMMQYFQFIQVNN